VQFRLRTIARPSRLRGQGDKAEDRLSSPLTLGEAVASSISTKFSVHTGVGVRHARPIAPVSMLVKSAFGRSPQNER